MILGIYPPVGGTASPSLKHVATLCVGLVGNMETRFRHYHGTPRVTADRCGSGNHLFLPVGSRQSVVTMAMLSHLRGPCATLVTILKA